MKTFPDCPPDSPTCNRRTGPHCSAATGWQPSPAEFLHFASSETSQSRKRIRPGHSFLTFGRVGSLSRAAASPIMFSTCAGSVRHTEKEQGCEHMAGAHATFFAPARKFATIQGSLTCAYRGFETKPSSPKQQVRTPLSSRSTLPDAHTTQ